MPTPLQKPALPVAEAAVVPLQDEESGPSVAAEAVVLLLSVPVLERP